MTSLAGAEAKYGHLVLKIGTLDGFLKLDVVLNQPDIDAVLRARAADIARYAHEIRTRALPSLSASSSRSARK
jgi:hypothetical protein